MFLKYIVLATLTLGWIGCSSSQIDDEGGSDQDGCVTLSVAISDTLALEDDSTANDALIESSVVRIYTYTGDLVRYYSGVAGETITEYLAAGKYYFTLTAGESVAATFNDDELYYFGQSKNVSVVSKQTLSGSITATLQNVMCSIEFDDSTLGDRYSSYHVVAYAVASADDITADTPTLTFSTSTDGYFLMEEGVENIVWQFVSDNEIVAEGVLEGVESAHQYKLSFKYTDYLDVTPLTVNLLDPEIFDDSFGFKVQPVLETLNFDIDETQFFIADETYEFEISTITEISHINVTVDGKTYSTASNDEGISFDKANGKITISGEIFADVTMGGEQIVDVAAVDISNASGIAHITVMVSGFYGVTNEDFWANTASLEVYTTNPDVQDVKTRYRYAGDVEWSESYSATKIDDNTWSATATSDWEWSTNDSGLAVSRLTRGILPSKTYECQSIIDGVEGNIAQYTTSETAQVVPYGSLDDSSLSCFTENNEEDDVDFWASGNNSYTSTLCSFNSTYKCAYLKAKNASYVVVTVFAAGNLYSGTFDMGSTSGTANFGQKFEWEARPTSLNFNYRSTVGSSDKNRVFIAIVDWTARRGVTVTTSSSSSNPPSGYWDPETATTQSDNGAVIGYGSVLFDTTTSSFAECEVPIYYYDNVTKPTSGNYSIVISATTSYRGDYAEGSEDSALWVDDFKFGY